LTSTHLEFALRSDIEMVTYALQVEAELLPLVPELLADLDELGGYASVIAEVLADMALPQSTRVIDLGCGNGAAAQLHPRLKKLLRPTRTSRPANASILNATW
jgi:hypothetical protein